MAWTNQSLPRSAFAREQTGWFARYWSSAGRFHRHEDSAGGCEWWHPPRGFAVSWSAAHELHALVPHRHLGKGAPLRDEVRTRSSPHRRPTGGGVGSSSVKDIS
jgi:hypothetical protein